MGPNKEELSEEFAVKIVKLGNFLRDQRKETVISNQIYKSGTSIGANIAESKYAETDQDYIHKLSISQKEANETLYWLRVLYKTKYITQETYNEYKNDCSHILRILSKVITQMKNKNQK